ncbi:TPA: hypothetical protein ACU93F_002217 [Legionella pneumophila]
MLISLLAQADYFVLGQGANVLRREVYIQALQNHLQRGNKMKEAGYATALM